MPDTGSEKLHTLTEISKLTSISMPTLQRYKKLYQDRIPSVGEGRSQRYPKEALDIFRELKKENVGKRGRPRKSASAAKPARQPAARRSGRPPAKGGGGKGEGLLTLTQIGELTNISYPTLLRYVKTHLKDIPHVGKGRARRYKPEAVEVFKRLRAESGRGRKPSAATGRGRKAAAGGRGPGRPRAMTSDAEVTSRLREMEKNHKRLEKELERLRKQLSKPFRVSLNV